MNEQIKKKLGIRSPSLEMQGYYRCERCKFSDSNCVCVVCEDGEHVVCTLFHKHKSKYDTCRFFA